MEKIRKTQYNDIKKIKLYLITESNCSVRITLVWKKKEKLTKVEFGVLLFLDLKHRP